MYRLRSKVKIHYDYLGAFIINNGQILEINKDTAIMLKNIERLPKSTGNSKINKVIKKLIQLNIIEPI